MTSDALHQSERVADAVRLDRSQIRRHDRRVDCDHLQVVFNDVFFWIFPFITTISLLQEIAKNLFLETSCGKWVISVTHFPSLQTLIKLIWNFISIYSFSLIIFGNYGKNILFTTSLHLHSSLKLIQKGEFKNIYILSARKKVLPPAGEQPWCRRSTTARWAGRARSRASCSAPTKPSLAC